ncbi:cell division protein FtsX [Fibrobacterales bacterium]|nr:cell division protein FtsX [Fibrobacterales bacterium]
MANKIRFGYLTAEAFKGLVRHRIVIVPSIATIFLCSFLLIASLSALRFAISMSSHSASLYRVEAFLFEPPAAGTADSLTRIMLGFEGVQSLVYVSKEEALSEFKKSFPEEMLYLVDGNPLPASFRIQIRPSSQNLKNLSDLCEKISAFAEVSAVQSPIEWVQKWESFKWHFFVVPIFLAALMLGILWLIMSNAMRLTLISRKELVENIKYSGGTPFFIQFPFVLEGLLQGFIGSFAAVILWKFLENSLLRMFPVALEFIPDSLVVCVLAMAFIAVSEALVSFVVVRKFLVKGI